MEDEELDPNEIIYDAQRPDPDDPDFEQETIDDVKINRYPYNPGRGGGRGGPRGQRLETAARPIFQLGPRPQF